MKLLLLVLLVLTLVNHHPLNNMIYLAEKIIDVQNAIDLLIKFLGETSYNIPYKNREHLGKLIYSIINSKNYIWIGEIDNKPAGILIAIIEPNMWIPELKQMRELVWYVLPEHRNSSLGGKLFCEYCKTAEDLMNKKIINGYFTTTMPTTNKINFEKRGFVLKEHTYLKMGEI